MTVADAEVISFKEERLSAESHSHHRHSNHSSSSQSRRHGDRRLYFVAGSLSGFVLGCAAVAVGLALGGNGSGLMSWPVLVMPLLFLPCVIGSAALVNHLYSEFRRRRQ